MANRWWHKSRRATPPILRRSAGEIALKHTNEPVPSLRELRPDIPEAVDLVVRVALAKSPNARFPSAAALAESFLAAVTSDSPPVISVAPQRRIAVRSRRTNFTWTRALSLLTIALLLSGLVGTLFLFSTLPLHLQEIPGFPFHGDGQSGLSGLLPGRTDSASPTSSGTHGGAQPTSIPGNGSNGQATPTRKPTQTPVATGTVLPGPTGTPAPTPIACTPGTLSIDGSSNLEPFLQRVNTDLSALCSGLTISLKGDGSRTGLNYLLQGQIDTADSDLAVYPSLGLTDHAIAALVYTLIVSPDVQVSGLSSAEIQSIYQGQITNWAQVGGPDESITVILRPSSDAINAIFRAFVLNGQPQHVKGIRLKQDSPNSVVQAVSSLPGAISYVPLVATQVANAQPLAIDGVSPSTEALLQGTYSFWSVEHLYTTNNGTTQFQAYLEFVTSGQETSLMSQFGAVPIGAINQDILSTHLPGPELGSTTNHGPGRVFPKQIGLP